MKEFKIFTYLSFILLLTGITFLTLGFDRMHNYNNPDSEESYLFDDDSEEPKNAYVGGDAYNFIINGTHSTAYFVLASAMFILSVLLFICQIQYDTRELIRKTQQENEDDPRTYLLFQVDKS
ncbi:hypothetical protein [Halobacillus sp. K22]|uniref:hypothetical protein n=1 Tax=Halobacillus sp. K22 TaxID=3457431 RepID=UPI003FCDC459